MTYVCCETRGLFLFVCFSGRRRLIFRACRVLVSGESSTRGLVQVQCHPGEVGTPVSQVWYPDDGTRTWYGERGNRAMCYPMAPYLHNPIFFAGDKSVRFRYRESLTFLFSNKLFQFWANIVWVNMGIVGF